MKTEWWYDDATYHYSDHTTLALARLAVREGGTAQILTDGGEVIELENEDEASLWLVSEEYRRLDSLLEDLWAEDLPIDPRMKTPTGTLPEEVIPQMVIVLEPPSHPAARDHTQASPAGRGEPTHNSTPLN